jgi:peptide deformylase
MTVLTVLRMGHPVLLQVALPVGDPTTPAIRRLAADMVETMHAEEGIGIAAPQIGQSLRLIVALPLSARRAAGPAEEVEPLVLVDPVLEPDGEAMEEAVEGCLSIPGLRGEVPRFARVRWRASDLDGQEIGGVAEGLFARVLQHEVDHLDGILYPMRMTNLRSLAFLDAVPGPDDAPDQAPDGGRAAAKDSGS